MGDNIVYPKSEQTLKKNKYFWKGIKFINDMGEPCEYRLEKDGKDLKIMIKYYRRKFLTEYGIK